LVIELAVILIDLRNISRPDDMAGLGFTYESVSRWAESCDHWTIKYARIAIEK